MSGKKQLKREIQFNGKLITAIPPSLIGPNFQALKNMRYVTGAIPHIKTISGMSKINTTSLALPKVRSGIHFRKDQPEESHVLVQAYNSDGTIARIYENKTTVPDQGDFESTAIYTPDNNGSKGRWCIAPDGDVAYCNGEETCLYGGEEREIAGFINYDPSGSFKYDFTDQVRNKADDSQNVATLNSVDSGVDANVMALFHFENNLNDSSPTTPHTATGANITYDTDTYFDSYRADFNGTSSKITIPDDADFDFSGGSFTIDLRLEIDSLSSNNPIYYQQTDANNYFKIYVDTDGRICVSILSSGSEVLNSGNEFKSTSEAIEAGTEVHVEITEDGNNWYIFVDGTLQGYLSDTGRCADYTGDVTLGSDGTNYFDGKMDELRISNVARHTSNFEVLSQPYSDNASSVNIYLGAIRPIDGFKLYVKTPNTSTSSMSVFYYNGSEWKEVSFLSDGTSSGGISLAQTGKVAFSSTVGAAKIKYIDDVVVYWYKIVIDAVSANTSIYHVTISCPFQTIKDIWDGLPREIASCQIKRTSYEDVTLSVRENTYPYSTTDTQNMAEFDDLTTSQNFIVGFTERQTAINIRFVSGHVNTSSGTVMRVKYWNGTSWVKLNIDDGTISDGSSFAKSGTISWDAPPASGEFVKSISNDALLYYYKFSFSNKLSSDIQVYYINGIPAQQNIKPYKFPLHAQNRLLLCCNEKEGKNTILVSAEGTSGSFNGNDSTVIALGDNTELTGGAWLYTQFGSALYNTIVIFKKTETWAIVGNSPEDWVHYRISPNIGCVAPETIRVVDVNTYKNNEGASHSMVIWQGSKGIYISDGRTPILISDDIKDVFDRNSDNHINFSMISESVGFYDRDNEEYHWCYAAGTSTTLNKEKVFSLRKMAWFDIERHEDLQYGIEVLDSSGNSYNYGFTDSGYMYRLEHGSDFDGNSITGTVQLGDIALMEGATAFETASEYHGLIAMAQPGGNVTVTHYSDGSSTGNAWNFDLGKSGYNLIMPVRHEVNTAVFHSWEFVTAEEFEPLYFFVYYSPIRQHLRDWR